MTTHLTKIWWDLNKDKLVEQVIPESEIYKRKWVGLTDEEVDALRLATGYAAGLERFTAIAQVIEAKLKEKNT